MISRRKFLKMAVAAATTLAGFSSLPKARNLFAASGELVASGKILKRAIPSTGEELAAVGLGTWQTFDAGASDSERSPLREVLRLFFESGGTVIDSSPMYGRAERVVGDLTAELDVKDRAFFATKVWTTGKESGISQMNDSFKKFGVERMDLMQIHNLVDWQTHMETLGEWKEQGRIRYTGITHYLVSAFDRLEEIMKSERPDFVQLPYSIELREAEKRLLPLALDLGIAVLVNRPFEGGGLFTKVRGKEIPAWAAEFECTSWAQFFLKYILAHPAVTCVIPATSKPHHLIDNMRAGLGRLPDETGRKAMTDYFDSL